MSKHRAKITVDYDTGLTVVFQGTTHTFAGSSLRFFGRDPLDASDFHWNHDDVIAKLDKSTSSETVAARHEAVDNRTA